eukprot:15470583-Alexandrium_andersonii.AAC.1
MAQSGNRTRGSGGPHAHGCAAGPPRSASLRGGQPKGQRQHDPRQTSADDRHHHARWCRGRG